MDLDLDHNNEGVALVFCGKEAELNGIYWSTYYTFQPSVMMWIMTKTLKLSSYAAWALVIDWVRSSIILGVAQSRDAVLLHRTEVVQAPVRMPPRGGFHARLLGGDHRTDLGNTGKTIPSGQGTSWDLGSQGGGVSGLSFWTGYLQI